MHTDAQQLSSGYRQCPILRPHPRARPETAGAPVPLQTHHKGYAHGADGQAYVIIPTRDFVAEPITGLNRKHAYGRTDNDVGPVVAVAAATV